MRIIKKATLVSFWEKHPDSQVALERWHQLVDEARWQNLNDAKSTFPHADQVTVRSGRHVVIFNIAGNRYRLITAIHFNTQMVYILRVLTHQEYDRSRWKEEL